MVCLYRLLWEKVVAGGCKPSGPSSRTLWSTVEGSQRLPARALKQRLPNHSMCPQGGLVKTQISEPHPPASLGWSLRICLSNRFSEEAGAEVTRTHSEDHCDIEQEFLVGIMPELNFRAVQLFVQSQTTNKRENEVLTQIRLTQTPWPFYSRVCFHG